MNIVYNPTKELYDLPFTEEEMLARFISFSIFGQKVKAVQLDNELDETTIMVVEYKKLRTWTISEMKNGLRNLVSTFGTWNGRDYFHFNGHDIPLAFYTEGKDMLVAVIGKTLDLNKVRELTE